jgi:hypothetical protein
MKMQFDPNNEAAYHQRRDDLVARFEATSDGRDLGWVASGVMDFKWGYLDGDLSRWTPEDIAEILLGLYPAKVVLDREDLDLIPTGFAAFMRFLFHAGVMPAPEAHTAADTVERLRPRFHAEALDESNWSMGKRLMAAAQSDGVDMADAGSLQQFMERFNERPLEERDAILGPSILPDPGSAGGLLEPLPSVTLAQHEELEAAARAALWPERVRRLVEFVGDGRPVTDTGKLKLADGEALIATLETDDSFNAKIGDRVFKTMSTVELRDVHLTFLIALESNTLVLRGKKVVPGPNVVELADPLESLYGLWLTLVKVIGPTRVRYRDDNYGFGWFADELDEMLPVLLLEFYRHGEMSIDEAATGMWKHMTETFVLDDLSGHRLEMEIESVEWSLRRAFDRLEEFGTVKIEGVEETPSRYGSTPDRAGGTVGLSPLGMWVMQRLASRVTSAPVVGALRESTVDELLAAASDLPESEGAAEIDAWVDHHGSEAAALLVSALRSAGETGRGLAFRALLRIGPDAAGAVSAMAGDPEFDQFVTIWRVDTLSASPAEMDCEGDPDRFVRLLGTVIELWGSEAAVSAWAGPAARTSGLVAMLERVWRVDRPETEDVLAAIGTSHPDKQISKAARKALFKYRSVG